MRLPAWLRLSEAQREGVREAAARAGGRFVDLATVVAERAPPFRARYPLCALAGVFVLGLATVAYCIVTLPVGGGLAIDPTPSALVLQADDGQVFATRGTFKGEKLTAAELPPQLAQAVVAIEDRRFYEHPGIDPWGTLRALWHNALAGGTREGGSTITQQLARNTYLSPERSLRRKLQEALLALWLEHQLDKQEILLRYLNTAYFGAGAYGVDAASKRYFGKKARDLNLSEAAMLAGLVRAPSQLAPIRNLAGARRRAEQVLAAMVETGAISKAQADAARAHPAVLRLPPETAPGSNYFVDAVSGDVRRLLGLVPTDLTLRTTLNQDLQAAAETVVEKHLAAEGAAKGASQAALVALAPDGAVRALVGGRDYEASQFNRVTQARRQPGSLFKLFVYLTAFERGLTPDSVVVDRPIRIGDWEPENYESRYRGPVTLRTAFAHSINTVAVQLAEAVGIPAVIDTAHRLGVQSDLPAVPSLALGSAEVTLLEMTGAFASVATDRSSVEPYTIRAVETRGKALYTRPPLAPEDGHDLARAELRDLLAAVVREGTGKAARLPIPVAGKTGTTQDYRDAWFIGFTPDLVVGVWVGNDDNSPMRKVTGGDIPARIWHDFVAEAEAILAKRKPALVATTAEPATTGTVASGPANAGALHGSARVLDTGTLALDGRIVRLAGVEGVRGPLARQLRRFIGGREIACEPAGDETYRCSVGDDDLSETVIINGGGRAAPDAAPELQSAEEKARSARVGLWRHRR